MNYRPNKFESLVSNIDSVQALYNRFRKFIDFQAKYLRSPKLWNVVNSSWMEDEEKNDLLIEIKNIDRIYHVSHSLTEKHEYFLMLIRMEYEAQPLYIEFWVIKNNNNNKKEDDEDIKNTVIEADINIFRNANVFMSMVGDKLLTDSRRLIYQSLERDGNCIFTFSYLCHESLYRYKKRLRINIPEKILPGYKNPQKIFTCYKNYD